MITTKKEFIDVFIDEVNIETETDCYLGIIHKRIIKLDVTNLTNKQFSILANTKTCKIEVEYDLNLSEFIEENNLTEKKAIKMLRKQLSKDKVK